MAARTRSALLLALAACGDDGAAARDGAVDQMIDTPANEVCTGGGDEDGDTFVDCDDDDCWEDAACYQFDDDVDLLAPDGDPALDIDKFRVTLAAGTATFFSTFEADWPPNASIYTYYVLFEIDNDGNTPQASVTLLHNAGVDTQMQYGVSAANVTVRQVPRGIWVRMTGVPVAGQKFYVESRIQKTMGGPNASDTVVGAPAALP